MAAVRRMAAIAAFAGVCLGVTGCAGSGDPRPTPPTTSTAGPSSPAARSSAVASPTAPASPSVPADVPTTGPNVHGPAERPPVEPVEATKHTAEGAKAFAEFFVKTIDWGYATTSSTYIRHYAESRCLGCRQFADGVDRAYRAGHRYVGGRFTITGSTAKTYSRSNASVLVSYDALSFEEVDKSGHGIAADPARTGQRFVVDLAWTSTAWRVKQLAVAQ
jgi:hypothetical protein